MDLQSAQAAFEGMSTAIVIVDHDLRLANLNPAAEMLFQLGARSVIGKPVAELIPRGNKLAHVLERMLHDLHPVTVRGMRLALADKRTITIDCTVTPLTEGSHPAGLLIEINRVDRLLRLAHEEKLRARHAANRAVIKGLAHEIKNPLGGLRGAAQLLERELDTPEQREYTQIIIDEADRLRKLVDRMMGPNTPMTLVPVNIHRVLEHVRSLMLAENPQELAINTAYDPSLPEIIGDSEQLIQAVLNITRNAVQAMEGTGIIEYRTHIERQFTMDHKRHRLSLCVEIEDNGPGIPRDLVDDIFYPLVTGRPEGTGLGLAIAQDIMTRHGGLIECRSQPGSTIFTLHLPLEQPSNE